MSTRDELERRLDLAADLALRTRERLETAVNSGEVPTWVLEACNVLERASLQYGEIAEQLRPATAADVIAAERELPENIVTLQSLTIH
jgi:hypothetical protein